MFDVLLCPVRSEVPGIVPVDYTWMNGFLTRVTQRTRTMLLGYDDRGNLSTLTDPLSRATTFEYDAVDRLIRQVMPGNREILFPYDANGNLTSITPPGRSSHLFGYTSVDLGDTYEPPAVIDGGPTRYEYNQDRELTRVLRPDGKALVFTYDGAGRLSTLDAAGSVLTYGYDAGAGRLTSVTGASGTVGYTLDGPLVTGTSWSGAVNGAITWQCDNEPRISSETVNGTAPVTVQYDGDSLPTTIGALSITRDPQNGRLTGTSLGTVTDTLSYDAFGDLSGYTATAAGTQALGIAYTRDDAGRIVAKQESCYGVTFTESYEYDEEARLAKVYRNGDLVSSYTYDANGNRLTRTTAAGVETATYDGQDRLLTYDAATYTYTSNGELLTKTDGNGTTGYSYDTLGNLRTVILPDGTTIEYVIDGLQRRVGKKVNGTLVRSWLYSGQLQIAAEVDGSGAVVSRFVYASRSNVPDYMIRGGNTYRIVSDHLGSPRYVLDVTTGNIMQSMDYDEFGNVVANSNPGFQPFGFAGGLYDRDTGLTRFGARDYDPRTGRWTAKDPIGFGGGDTSLDVYVANDPVNLLDPTGTDWIEALETVSDFSAAFGDTLTLGATYHIRELTGANSVVDACSEAYKWGDRAAIAHSFAMLGSGVARGALAMGGRSGSIATRFGRGLMRFFHDPRAYYTVRAQYWGARGGAGSSSLHHWLSLVYSSALGHGECRLESSGAPPLLQQLDEWTVRVETGGRDRFTRRDHR